MSRARVGAAWLLVCAALGTAPAAPAQVYRWTDSSGRVHYGDRKPADAAAQTVAIDERQPAVPPPARPAPAAAATAVPALQSKRAQPEVTMYMSPSCGYCVRAARWFESRGIAWRNVDVTASPQGKAEFDALGGRGTPLIYIAGQRIEGFSAERLQHELARYGW